MNSTLLTAFIGITAVAVLVQMVCLIALALSARKVAQEVSALSRHVEQDVVPAVQQAHALIKANSEKINAVMDNTLVTTTLLRNQMERLSATVDDIVDRTRLQVMRADEVISHTIERVEETAAHVQSTVLSPVRKLSAVLTGIVAGFGEYAAGRKVQHARTAVPRDEMFI